MPDIDLTPRPTRWPFSFEKWYIDTLMPDGSVLLVYLARIHLLGMSLARVTADLFRCGEPPISGSSVARTLEGRGHRLRFGPATIQGEQLSFATPGLSGELRFRAAHPPAELGMPFLKEAGRQLDWIVEVPDAEVEGSVEWPGGTMRVAGRGYRDRVWLDIAPWRFPVAELTWGRAAAGSRAATWVTAKTRDSEIRRRWLDGQVINGTGWPIEVSESRVLLDVPIYDLDSLRLGALQPLLRRWYGDPRQTKWSAQATISGQPGVAIHEFVRWH